MIVKILKLRPLRTAVFFAVIVGFWALLSARNVWDPVLFPSPAKVAQTATRLASDKTLLYATAVSLRRVLVGYGISLVVGIPLGVLIARSKLADDTIGAVVSGFQALPSICWLPLALLWFGLSPNAILFVVVMGSLTTVAVTVKDGVQNLPPSYVRAARTMGAGSVPMLFEVILPAVGPSILTAAKVGWSYAWRALMSGELLFVSLGLGHLLMMGRELADMAQVLVVMGVIMLIGLLADRFVFGAVEGLVRERWGLGTQ